MLDLPAVAQVLLSIAGILGGLAFALSFFRSSYGKQTIELLRGDIDDANERAKNYKDDGDAYKEKAERKVAELQTAFAVLETQVSEKNQEIHVLRSIVTGKDQLDRIEKALLDFIGGMRK